MSVKVCAVCCKYRPVDSLDTVIDCPTDGVQSTIDVCAFCGGLFKDDPASETVHTGFDFCNQELYDWVEPV